MTAVWNCQLTVEILTSSDRDVGGKCPDGCPLYGPPPGLASVPSAVSAFSSVASVLLAATAPSSEGTMPWTREAAANSRRCRVNPLPSSLERKRRCPRFDYLKG